MKFDPGSFREEFAVQLVTRTGDGRGGFSAETWADVDGWTGLFGDFDPLRGNELQRAMQTTASSTTRLRSWWLEGLKATEHRIRRVRDDATFEIVSPPVPDDMRLFMELTLHQREEATVG